MSRVLNDWTLCLVYLRCELRRRWWQALATAAGLAVGVALVITVTAAASGAGAAEARVLDRLDHAAASNGAAPAIGAAVATTSGIAADLGTWVAVAALTASFLLAALLTLASVTRRVREFGTLKALGWQARRIVVQVLAETATIGIAGTLAGIALGYGGTALLAALSPTVEVTEFPGASPGPSGPHTVAVHFDAPISLETVALAATLGILGALLAGTLGAWRAGRLSPAAALSRTG